MNPSQQQLSPSHGPFAFVIDLWRNRELLWQFTLRNIEVRHRGSHLGLVWSFLNPLLMLGLYVFVFGYVLGGTFNVEKPESRIDYALTVFLGLSIFHLVAEVLSTAPVAIVSNPNFVKKVVFPLEILPAANVAASLFHTLISLVLVLVGLTFFGPGINANILWLPLILFPLVLLILGGAWFLSAIGVFFRDIGQTVGFLSMALLFASAVFYPIQSIPQFAWSILRFNPVLLAIELSRDAVVWNHPLNLRHLSYLTLTSMVVCIVGYWCFQRMRPAFADVL